MFIKNHRLFLDSGEQVGFVDCPNRGGPLTARYLVMHYTAGRSAESSIAYLCKKEAKASAHLVIGRDGSVTQLVPFNRVAWHAGVSRWQGLTGLNAHSIGIELDNAGPLDGGPGNWRAWFERVYPDEEVMVAAHKADGVERGWHRYSELQLATALEAAGAIVAHYGLVDVLGHDDIAPERKKDPGPASPMESFRSRLIGRAEDDAPLFETIAALNIREGPGVRFAKLDASPPRKGTRLRSEMRDSIWHFVEVLDDGGMPQHTGWVHGNYIAPVSGAASIA